MSSATITIPPEGIGIESVHLHDSSFTCNFAYETGVVDVSEPREENVASFEDIISLLEGQCMSIKSDDGYWTYEVCVGSTIVQKHVGENAESFFLGHFSHNDPGLMKQVFKNGDACSVVSNTAKRQGHIKFVCDPVTYVPHILSVEERQTCEYDFVVSTKEVCSVTGVAASAGVAGQETWEMDIVETIEGNVMCTIANVENSLDSQGGSRVAFKSFSVELDFSPSLVSDLVVGSSAFHATHAHRIPYRQKEFEVEISHDSGVRYRFDKRERSEQEFDHSLEYARLSVRRGLSSWLD